MRARSAFTELKGPARPRLEVADIFRAYGAQYRLKHPVSPQQGKAMRDIQACRTQSLGGHVDTCEDGCGYQRISYNSCRNRHCPKCQGLQSMRWIEQRIEKILPTPYFHMVFTVPHELHAVIIQNQRLLYNLLFRAAAKSLLQCARQWHRLRAEVGFTAILHTWNQDLLFHPHVHVIVTGGGLDQARTRWIRSRDNFLVPVRALSKIFRSKLLNYLKDAFAGNLLTSRADIQHLHKPHAFERLIRKLYRKKWVVYCKQPFGGPEQVLKYLGLYTHKVAISNHRLVEINRDMVTFLARDNHSPGKRRSVCVTAESFIRRFLIHILPAGFVKIRHYGLMAPKNAKTGLETARALIQETLVKASGAVWSPDSKERSDPEATSWTAIFLRITAIHLGICPRCGGKLSRQPLTVLQNVSTSMPYGPAPLDSS
jgi:hypothetical protein